MSMNAYKEIPAGKADASNPDPFYFPSNEGRRIKVCLSKFVSTLNFFYFDIGISYFAHGSIIMRRCIAYIPIRR